MLDECQIDFIPKNNQQKYCEPRHSRLAASRKHRQSFLEKECINIDCEIKFKPNDKRQKYCSHRCAALDKNYARGSKLQKDCLGLCSKKIQNRKNCNYCSNECKKVHKLSLWWNDEWEPIGRFPKWLREMLVDAGCVKCGWNEYNPITHRSACQIDHIDGNNTNNKRKNIRVLCPNCHSLTPTFGALNYGVVKMLKVK